MGNGTILVVDDDPKVLEILEKTLSKKGHKVSLAKDAEEALGHYKAGVPDMVVLDLALPDMDGRDLLAIMQSAAGVDPVPSLLISANSDPAIIVNALNSGADDFLVKPFSLTEFYAKVAKVLESHDSSRQLVQRTEALETEVSKEQETNIQVNRELKRQLISMRTLYNVTQDLIKQLDLDDMVNGFALTVIGELQASSIALFASRRANDDKLYLQGIKGLDRAEMADLVLEIDNDFNRWLLSHPEPQKLARRRDAEWLKTLPDVRLAVFEYVTPIVVKQDLRGLVFIGPRLADREYTKSDLDMLHTLSNAAGIGLDNARLFQELQNTYLSTVKALMSIIEAKDPYTKGHTERVADYSVALGTKLRLSKDDIRDLAFGAVLHDIGKLVVYEKILNKPGELNEEEWEILKEHPKIGADIIANMDFLAGTADLVRHHHENYNGNGYPDGLKGEDIPMGARIIAVTDAYDAMTTDRAYRKALGRRAAVEQLRSMAGTQFDPDVVKTFIELIEKDGFTPRNNEELVKTNKP